MAGRMMLVEEALGEEETERMRVRRTLRDAFPTASIPDFHVHYRLSRALFEELCCDLVPLLPPKQRRHGVDPTLKILTALCFYARGSYQGSVGQNMDSAMAQPTASKCIAEVTSALNHPTILRKYIKFPQNALERNAIKRKFYEKWQFPGIIGCIDCTHIAIVRPAENEERFFNRKHFHSLNAQIICDADNIILNVDASHGGASHDSFIWNNNEIKDHLQNINEEETYLLGDSGYALREFLLTPIANPNDGPETRYNAKHKSVRSVVERTFGILKGRFRCMLSARQLHYCPEVAGKITIACCVLHNLCTHANMEVPELLPEELNAENQMAVQVEPAEPLAPALRLGQQARARIVQQLENLR